jgi:hypothetical protein
VGRKIDQFCTKIAQNWVKMAVFEVKLGIFEVKIEFVAKCPLFSLINREKKFIIIYNIANKSGQMAKQRKLFVFLLNVW